MHSIYENDVLSIRLCVLTNYISLQYTDHPYGDLYTKLILFKHDNDTNKLTLLAVDDEITDGMIIEVILRGVC